jgi:hypothetical protein
VHAGLANFDLHGPLPRFAFLRHMQCRIDLASNVDLALPVECQED